MTDKKIIFEKALKEIEKRRNIAKMENNAHFIEAEKNVPEILEINSQIAKTGSRIVGVINSGQDVERKMEEFKQANLQAQRMIKTLLVQHGYPEDYLSIKYYCEKCSDTGFIGGNRCSCLTNLVASMTSKEMNKKSQIKLCSFDSFDINLYRGADEADTERKRNTMRRIFNTCKSYAENFTTNSDNLLMFGRTGLGKTHLSLAIANEVLKNGYNVLYDSTLNYLNQIEREHFRNNSADNGDTLTQLLSADLLILDDLGSEFTKPFYVSTIYNIINTRLNKGLPTIISTNLNHEEMLKKYDERIISRLFAIYESFEFVGMDIRLIRRKLGV